MRSPRKESVRPGPHENERIDSLLKVDAILITGLIKLELPGGTRSRKEYLRLKNRLAALEQVKTNSALWDAAFELAFFLRRRGIAVPYTDLLVATYAHQANATLVHADSHFNLISHNGNAFL